MSTPEQRPRFVVCLRNDGYEASLEPRKIYQTLPDALASSMGFIRVIDESDEDYLFPADMFAPIELPLALVQAFAQAS